MNVYVSDTGANGALVALTGDVDIYTAPKLSRALLALSARGRIKLTVNLEAVPYIDSTGMGALLSAARRVEPLGGAFSVVTNDDRLIDLFERLGIADVIGVVSAQRAGA